MRKVYLDNAATTAVKPEVVEAMLPYFAETYGNPSSVHGYGREAKQGMDEARALVAGAINAKPEEIIFTGSGTESDNFVLRGVAMRMMKKGKHIITTSVEHHAVLHTCEELEKEMGLDITYLPVDEYGLVSAEQVKEAIRDDTILVSIMFANNEIGTIMPVAEIGAVCREKNVLFHTDAVQAVGHFPIDVDAMNIDFLSLSAHKFHGPKGVGVLYARKGVRPHNLIFGGGQEKGWRPSTENVPGIVGLGKAISLCVEKMEEEEKYIQSLRDKLIKGIAERIPEVRLNGHPNKRLANNVNFSIRYIEGESLLLMLDMKGIAASSGSACTSGSLDPSHVLLAIGLPHEIAHGSLRLSLSAMTSEEDIDYVLDTLPGIVERLRAMSPLYKPVQPN
ncbi:cysteine desulfurase NifS [Christensenellaceae bacterium OttesenSCG-928-M15]|nr:cysteine desulfurase NifS [Christensenellaceae bacterium OttesenSCG-928-M15]